jgi:hypothetical protein
VLGAVERHVKVERERQALVRELDLEHLGEHHGVPRLCGRRDAGSKRAPGGVLGLPLGLGRLVRVAGRRLELPVSLGELLLSLPVVEHQPAGAHGQEREAGKPELLASRSTATMAPKNAHGVHGTIACKMACRCRSESADRRAPGHGLPVERLAHCPSRPPCTGNRYDSS